MIDSKVSEYTRYRTKFIAKLAHKTKNLSFVAKLAKLNKLNKLALAGNSPVLAHLAKSLVDNALDQHFLIKEHIMR